MRYHMFYEITVLHHIPRRRETSFGLTYEIEVFILVEIGELIWRIVNPLPLEGNRKAITKEIDLQEEKTMVDAFTIAIVK